MKLSAILLTLIITSTSVFAQKEDPKGLYRLSKLTYENNRPEHTPEFDQYKYCSEKTPVTVLINSDTQKEFTFSLRPDEPRAYKYTGDVPTGRDGKGTRIYDSNDKHFALKWFNSVRPNEPEIFPLGEFITELYDKNNISKRMSRSIKLLEMKDKNVKHKFAGYWGLVGTKGTVAGVEIIQTPSRPMYKIYGEKDMIVNIGTTFFYWDLDVKSNAQIIEKDHDCKIEWLNDDVFTLSFTDEHGRNLTEVWTRTGLPKTIQSIFGTDVEIKPTTIHSTL
ncbi:MAG: hypothetical protein J5663_02505 [Bacteroidaceae bacterium]|nr:hypothetical protein [Bacteroidaceae bacterium]